MLSQEDFNILKSSQYCDNSLCSCYNQVGVDNIRTNSRAKSQVYCKVCKNIWVVTKGTIFFDLRTPMDKVVKVLQSLARGMGVNNTCRQENVTADSILAWIIKASKHSNEFTKYMQQEMQLEQVQIDEFWSFIRKKKESNRRRGSAIRIEYTAL